MITQIFTKLLSLTNYHPLPSLLINTSLTCLLLVLQYCCCVLGVSVCMSYPSMTSNIRDQYCYKFQTLLPVHHFVNRDSKDLSVSHVYFFGVQLMLSFKTSKKKPSISFFSFILAFVNVWEPCLTVRAGLLCPNRHA